MNKLRHGTNSREGKQPITSLEKHNRHAGHARALRQLGTRAARRKANRRLREQAIRRFKEWTD